MTLQWTTRLLPLLLCLAAALPATAQDSKTVSREREALRRAQAALQQAQQQRDALQTANSALQQAQQDQAGLQVRSQARLASVQAELRQLRARLSGAQAEAAQQRQAHADALAQALAEADARLATAAQDQQRQLEALHSERDERSAANRALVARLEAATQALTEARERNRLLYAVAREAVDRYRGKTVVELALQDDPLLGLTAVRIESVAEDLMVRLDAQRAPLP